jgi:hypothetical protein
MLVYSASAAWRENGAISSPISAAGPVAMALHEGFALLDALAEQHGNKPGRWLDERRSIVPLLSSPLR